ncbi:polysaccharide pyruvyl transferase family protein [Plantactinospora endophytica]|uniref:Polysaccharide pyruvyl transferase n=1 Tax=Plantactinospora endophytica TaxID=673535 RepID=A0ABQ4DZ82_9ACTN|nr:polysaccharide pyruvyl transferase family protein [Plantactinospora endophytica]GIG87738.1 polysaccharide pyruvyl transferase [Plantactinospora endophytica]
MTSTRHTVLLRSSWATVNIGDVAHSPGVVRAFQRFAPEVEVILWPVRLEERERSMLRDALPDLRVVDGTLGADGPSTPELAAAIDGADVLMHGSGADAFQSTEIDWWRRHVGRPYGYFGVTVDPLCPPTVATLPELAQMVDLLPPSYLDDDVKDRLDSADFVYCRETLTLTTLRSQKITRPDLAFGPDGTFAFDHTDAVAAARLLERLGLQPGRFACFVPRLRYSPYAKIYGTDPTREQMRRDAVNRATVTPDLAVLAAAIETWVRVSGLPAIVVPEMSYAVELAHEHLPSLVSPQTLGQVRLLDRYWPLEEATGVYAVSSLVVSMECHSPILAARHAIPTIYLRQPTETTKSQMFADLGAPDLVIELDHRAAATVVAAVTDIATDPAPAVARSRRVAANADDALRAAVRACVAGQPIGSGTPVGSDDA